MKNTRLTFLISGSILLGCIIGLVIAGLLWMHFMRHSIAATFQAATMMQEVSELRSIRNGHADKAAKLLELHLDNDIIAAGMQLSKVPASRRDPSLVSALEQARDYRQTFPHKADSPQDEALIKKAFSLVGGKKSP